MIHTIGCTSQPVRCVSYSGGGISGKPASGSSSWIEVPCTLDKGSFADTDDRCTSPMLFEESEVSIDAGVRINSVPAGVCVSENRSRRSRMEGGLVGSDDEM